MQVSGNVEAAKCVNKSVSDCAGPGQVRLIEKCGTVQQWKIPAQNLIQVQPKEIRRRVRQQIICCDFQYCPSRVARTQQNANRMNSSATQENRTGANQDFFFSDTDEYARCSEARRTFADNQLGCEPFRTVRGIQRDALYRPRK
jgi:hypothetical protein